MILGVDEVGRGCWAGPLVMGAVVLGSANIEGLTDSKALSAKRRQVLSHEIYEKAAGVGLGWVSAIEIDKIGLSQSLRLACRRAVEQIKAEHSEIIIDGTVNFLSDTAKEPYVTLLKKADLLIPSVSAASIIAKVARDSYMKEQSIIYPGYGFEAHVGYGTSQHRLAVRELGVCQLHRLSIKPLAKYQSAVTLAPLEHDQSTKQIGDAAENEVARVLEKDRHTIIARNWRTKWCEIDVVSIRQHEIFFTEVKYRRSDEYGDGLAAITKEKQRQIRFAAELFLTKNTQYAKHEVTLLAADVGGTPASVLQLVELS